MNKNNVVLTKETVNELPAYDLDFYVFQQLMTTKGLTRQNSYAGLKSLNSIELALVATTILDDQVLNGGFNQFFYNHEGRFALEGYQGCLLMGATEHASIIQQATAIYQNGINKFRKLQEQGSLQAFSDSYKDEDFKAVDFAYYRLPRLLKFRVELIKANAELFLNKE
jgi:hypothetical protein